MADFTITISNAIQFGGPSVPSLWGTMVWGVDNWLESKDTVAQIDKIIQDSTTLDSAVQAIADFGLIITNSISFDSETIFESLEDNDSWFYVFPKPTLDAEDRDMSVWSEV